MATKAEVQRHIADKLRRLQETRKLTGSFVELSVIENITPGDWASIAGWIQDNNFQAIGKHISQLVRTQIASNAMREAAVILADDVLSLDEYAQVEDL